MAYGFSLFADPHPWLALVTACCKDTSVQEGVPRYEDLHHFKTPPHRDSDPEVLALVTNVQRNGPNMGKTCSPTVADKETTMKKRARRHNNDWHEQLTAEEFTQDSDPTPSMNTRDAIRSKIRVFPAVCLNFIRFVGLCRCACDECPAK